jgi:hypothetical protein
MCEKKFKCCYNSDNRIVVAHAVARKVSLRTSGANTWNEKWDHVLLSENLDHKDLHYMLNQFNCTNVESSSDEEDEHDDSEVESHADADASQSDGDGAQRGKFKKNEHTMENLRSRLDALEMHIPVCLHDIKPRSPEKNRFLAALDCPAFAYVTRLGGSNSTTVQRQLLLIAMLLRTLPPLDDGEWWTNGAKEEYSRILLALTRSYEYGMFLPSSPADINTEWVEIFLERTGFSTFHTLFEYNKVGFKACDTDEGAFGEHRAVVIAVLHFLMEGDSPGNHKVFGPMRKLGITARDDTDIRCARTRSHVHVR